MNTQSLGSARPAAGQKRTVNLLLALVLTATTPVGVGLAATSPATAATSTTTSMAPATYEKNVQYWVNRRRKARGLRPLRFARCTDRVAERWSGYLARNDLFFHQSMQDVLEKCDARYAGETLGRGDIRPRKLVRMWMRSPAHRKILLTRKARRIGVGAKTDSVGRWVVAANFMRF